MGDGPDGPDGPDVRDGMRIRWDEAVPMDDGTVLRADVFGPDDDGGHPVVLAYGPYAKGLAFQEGYRSAWEKMVAAHPDVAAGSTNRYQAWEVVDPEKWVPHGYVCVRVDARGFGRSPGFVEPWSPRERRDLYDCIEWAAAQPWSDGKVGLAGISYYAMNQWHVAGLRPPHLAAMVPWEGAADFYRDVNYHGGIRCVSMGTVWWDRVIASVQHGLGMRSPCNPNTGELACGPGTLSEEELAANRSDFPGEISAHRLDDEWHRARSGDLEDIEVPFLSAGNWGGHGLHLRGNVEGFLRAGSRQKWLEVHGREHWTEFYTDYGVSLQRRFFDHFLKGEDNGWDTQPRVMLRVRTVDGGFVDRTSDDWPLPETAWTRLHLQPGGGLALEPPGRGADLAYDALGPGVTFTTPPLADDVEIVGPVSARLDVSSSTTDADLFLVLRVFAPGGDEVVFQAAVDPRGPVGQGWLRASHRKLDPDRSTPWRPWHTHDEVWPLVPGRVEAVDVEIWPVGIVVPAGHRLALTVRGTDYENDGARDGVGAELSHFAGRVLRGSGIYLHDDPADRPPSVYGGTTTLHVGPEHEAFLLLPVVGRAGDDR